MIDVSSSSSTPLPTRGPTSGSLAPPPAASHLNWRHLLITGRKGEKWKIVSRRNGVNGMDLGERGGRGFWKVNFKTCRLREVAK